MIHPNQKWRGFLLMESLVHLGTLCIPFLYPFEYLLNTLYLSVADISGSFGKYWALSKIRKLFTRGLILRRFSWDPSETTIWFLSRWRPNLRVERTSSTLLKRSLCLAFWGPDIRHGTFHNNPPNAGCVALNAPNISLWNKDIQLTRVWQNLTSCLNSLYNGATGWLLPISHRNSWY